MVLSCKLCGGDDHSGVLSSSKKVSNINVFDWINCEVCLGLFYSFCLNNINIDFYGVDQCFSTFLVLGPLLRKSIMLGPHCWMPFCI